MKIDNEKFINVGKIVEYYGKDVMLKPSHIHAVTCWDTTSYLNSVGKIKVFKRCVKSKEKLNLLQDFVVPLTKKLLVKFQNLFKQCAPPEWKMNQLQRQE